MHRRRRHATPSRHSAPSRQAIPVTFCYRLGRAGGHGRDPWPHRSSPVTYDAWLEVLRSVRPRFEFTDPPLRHSLALAFAATADRLTAVLTDPLRPAGEPAAPEIRPRAADTGDMVRVRLDRSPLTATAAVAWSCDLPRHLQQVLFDTADTAALPLPAAS
jgi:hypothetical protein